uniref:F-box domain-containing protein n=1 Tax=Trichogramma kaykai TaxID=54128 RepID=A0ABD2XKU3_9HYME
MDSSEVLTIMKFFAKEGLFIKSVNFDVTWSVRHYAVHKMKETMIKEQMSVYDFIQLGPEEAAKQLTYADYYKFAQTCNKSWSFRASETCAVHLCETMSRGFFRRCAVYPFWELIHKRLPLEICEMILEHLTNEDFYHICLVASGQSVITILQYSAT